MSQTFFQRSDVIQNMQRVPIDNMTDYNPRGGNNGSWCSNENRTGLDRHSYFQLCYQA